MDRNLKMLLWDVHPMKKWVMLKTVKYVRASNPANNYLFKVNNINTGKRGEICPKLTIKTPIQCH